MCNNTACPRILDQFDIVTVCNVSRLLGRTLNLINLFTYTSER